MRNSLAALLIALPLVSACEPRSNTWLFGESGAAAGGNSTQAQRAPRPDGPTSSSSLERKLLVIKDKRSMIIHFNDGSNKLVEFPTPVADTDANLAARLKEALDARVLILEVDGALVAIPVESIKYLQSSPAPKKLPAYAIRGASFID